VCFIKFINLCGGSVCSFWRIKTENRAHRKTTKAENTKHPARDSDAAKGKIASTTVVQNHKENILKLFALSCSRIGNIFAQTTQHTGPHE